MVNRKDKIIEVSGDYWGIFCQSYEDFLNFSIKDFFLERELEKYLTDYKKEMKINEISFLKKDGTILPVAVFISPIINSSYELEGAIYVIQDISLIKKLEYEGTVDFLTEVYNRHKFTKMFNEKITSSIMDNKSIAILMLDIDRFKSVNDIYGHTVGDYVLKNFISNVKAVIEDHSTIGRYGGEEFIVLLENTDSNQAIKIAENIRKLIESTEFVCENKTIKITVSIGICMSSSEKNLKDMIKDADKALYEAKEQGRNRVVLKIR